MCSERARLMCCSPSIPLLACWCRRLIVEKVNYVSGSIQTNLFLMKFNAEIGESIERRYLLRRNRYSVAYMYHIILRLRITPVPTWAETEILFTVKQMLDSDCEPITLTSLEAHLLKLSLWPLKRQLGSFETYYLRKKKQLKSSYFLNLY